VNLIQYKNLHAVNLDHVRLVDLIISNHTNKTVGIKFEFANGDETAWLFEDQAEAIEVYEKLQSKVIRYV